MERAARTSGAAGDAGAVPVQRRIGRGRGTGWGAFGWIEGGEAAKLKAAVLGFLECTP